MTIVVKRTIVQRLAMFLVALQALVWKTSIVVAQETKNVDVDINMKGTGTAGPAWYGIWWIWVLVAVFIIVIVAVTSRGRSSD